MSVAIIGAGAAGASAAYHLSQYAALDGIPVNITVLDRNSYIGGRSTTVNAYNDSSMPVELGGSVFVQVNHILVDAVQTFNLSTSAFGSSKRSALNAPSLGVWNGQEFVFSTSSNGPTWWDTAKLLLKYGLAPIRTMRLMKATIGKFLKMYDSPIFPFESLTKTAQILDLTGITSISGIQLLVEHGVSVPFAEDIVQASTRVNYAQNVGYIHGLEAMVCMATDGAMSVEGGNWQIFDRMIAAANAKTLLNTSVTDIKRSHDNTFAVETISVSDAGGAISLRSDFDAVILAAPFQFSNITIHPPPSYEPSAIAYVDLHVTLFTSPHLLSPAYFGLPIDQPVPLAVLTTLPNGEHPWPGPEGVGSPGFFSISVLSFVTNPLTCGEEYLYKIFSPAPPTETWLSTVLGVKSTGEGKISDQDITWIYRKVWHSYPYEVPRGSFEELKLDTNLWYTGGMDGFISTMETNALMGKNVARLLADGILSQGKAFGQRVTWSGLTP